MHGLSFVRRNRKWLRRAVITAAGLLAVLALVAVLLCSFFGIHSRRDILGYRMMMHEHYHTIWKDLAWRRIRKGDPLDIVVQKYPPLLREDFGPYTHLSYIPPFNSLDVIAKDGKLIYARAGSCCWGHIFFDTPEEEKALDLAYSAYVQQHMLEHQAFQIHQVVKAGQDVFFAWVIERHVVPRSSYDPQMMEELRAIYGQDYLEESGMLTAHELVVEVTTVLHGDLQPGMILTIPNDQCGHVQPGDSDLVFLHVDDQRLLYNPQYRAEESYTTVPRAALDWYQSLTPEQVKDLEARRLAERAERLKLQDQAVDRYGNTAER